MRLLKKKTFAKSADSVLTDPSHFLEKEMSRKTFSRFIVNFRKLVAT